MHKYGDCSHCGGEVKEERVELDYRYKEKLYIFQNVPAGVCQQCGEKYLISEVAKKIEHSIQTREKWDKTINAPVGMFLENVAVQKVITFLLAGTLFRYSVNPLMRQLS